MRTEPSDVPPVAIVGMGCRLPGIESVDELWDVLEAQTDTVTPVPTDRFDVGDRYDSTPMTRGRTVSRHGGFLVDPFGFDAAFFGISPVEARAMDPQQRLLLHVVWEALESAGIRPSRLAGSRGGVFVGQATAEYAETDPRPQDPDVRGLVGSRLRAVTAGRVSYALDLRGPSVVLDTACSSSLVAVHAARQSLLTGESDLCIAAGVNVILSPHDAVAYSQGDMLSPGGRIKFGDARADGFVRSEGVGAVVLKRLDDALRDGDPVHAVLLGSATTNDGAASGLLLHPSVEGQAAMVREACRSAGIEPSELDYVEAHGTGTRVGDGVELQALAEAVGPGRGADRPLLTGSVKTNIGHTEATAGMAGLIKAVLMLRHGVVPASLHLDEAHPLLAQDDFPVRVVTRQQPLQPAGARALLGVSSFGLSGTNAQLVVGAHVPEPAPGIPHPATEDGPCLLVLSARTSGSLRRLARKYADYLGPSGPGRQHRIAGICAAAVTRRDAHPHRLWVVGHDHASLSRRLYALAAGETIADGGTGEAGLSGDKRLVFTFSGQGSQWAGMTRSLYRSSPAFRTALDACDRAVSKELGWSVLERLASDAGFPEDVSIVQPVLWAVQVALAAAWRERGLTPDLCIGHSMGEVAAAHVFGALSLGDAAAVICRRSRLMQRGAGRGAMLVVELPAARARQYTAAYEGAVCVAAENSPTTTVLAGDPVALARLRAELEERDVLCRSVKVNVASHSPQMDSLRDDLLQELAGLSPVPGASGMISTVHGCEVKGPELTAAYWVDNLRRPVQFADTVREVGCAAESVFLEISPHPVLVAPMNDTLGGDQGDQGDHGDVAVASLHAGQDEPTELARAAGRIFALGGRVDWRRWYGGDPRHVPSLPTYAWDVAQFRRASADSVATHGTAVPRVRQFDLASWSGTAEGRDGAAHHTGAPVPPVVYLAAMLETAQEADRAAAFELRDVKLGDAPVPLEEAGGTTLRVTLDGHGAEAGAARTVTAQAALQGVPDPVFCAWGRVVGADADDAEPLASEALDAALAGCGEYLGAQDLQGLAQRHGRDSQEPFRAVEHLWRRDGAAVARVRLPRPLSRADWEAGLQPLLAARPGAVSGDDGFAYVPVSIDSVRFFAELEPEFWSLIDVRTEGGGASLRADVLLIAPDRRVLARFSGIHLRRLARPSSRAGRPLAHVPALVSALTGQCAASVAGLAKKVTGPFGGGLLTGLLRSVVLPPADRDRDRERDLEREPAAARTAAPAPSVKEVAALPPGPGSAAEALLEHSAALLGMAASDIDERRSLRELGLDSLMASQLRQRLRRSLGFEVTAGRLLGAESIASLAKSLAPHGASPRFGQMRGQES
ncbi:type I polyketide synthase [Streptomyces formicae]|uniref:Malonyl CoA-acyl carrier protein transacylase n=1 Tax=Streptomyces formicae TaxID=1616117 RepID=A0A291Q3K3_9ACTN|nr:type I polyketide synthase [Streptomyces formicae]ATL26076.1 Malonyl CoA-acyl carrier protein transacylase [Streptomyces formicae]